MTGQRALITGVSGSGGSYLAEYLMEHHPGLELHGITRWHSTTRATNLRAVAEKITLHECDLTDMGSVLRALKAARPDLIFHLAASANVRASFDTPQSILHNNVQGTLNLLEAVRFLELNPVIQLCSTSEVYGQVSPDEVPIRENCPLRPASPYAVSKVAADLLGYSYFKSYGLRIVRTRMFSYLNPRRADLFATSFAYQVARIEAGRQAELRHGNLDSVRTLIDVRDAMESYWLATTRGVPGEVYNLGGKSTVSVGDLLRLLKEQARVPVPCRLDPALLRPADVTLQIPSTEKFERLTGWTPRFSLEESVRDLLAHCRREVEKEAS